MRAPFRSPTALPSRFPFAFPLPFATSMVIASLALMTATGCGRMIQPVDLPTMTFESAAPPIDGRIEVCVRPKLHKRQWNVRDHPYVIELGKRAAIHFERMVKTAFREAVTVYTDRCGSTSDTPWIEATIVSANRDYDGFEGGLIEQEPVDTALTMSFAVHADDGAKLWSTTVAAKHRSVDPAPLNVRTRRFRGSRDFGEVLRKALEEGYARLITSEEVRAAYGDVGLEAAPEDSSETPSAGDDSTER